MVNTDLILALVFYALLLLYFFTHRDKFQVQGKIIILYRTKLGLKAMDKVAKLCPRFLKVLGWLGIFIGFLSMIFIFVFLFYETIKLIFIPETLPALAPLIPGVKIPGIPVLPFWYFIVSIFIVATIHEFSHGVYARLSKIKIKSSGFAFFGPILGAFVEPNENSMKRKPKIDQLSILAAGPFSNLVLAGVILLFSIFVISPFAVSIMHSEGVKIFGLEDGFPLDKEGFDTDEEILEINSQKINNVDDFINVVKESKPGDKLLIKTNKRTATVTTVEHPRGEPQGYLGVTISPIKIEIGQEFKDRYGKIISSSILWIIGLLQWLFIINFGVGLFNLLPLGPIDGGKMFYVAALAITKDKKKSQTLWKWISSVSLFLILIQLFFFLVNWIF